MKKLNFFLLVVFLLFSGHLYSQVEDPYIDRAVYNPRTFVPMIYSPDAVVTIGDYDNFNIGTDFAEVWVAGNPRNPKEFAGAWNNTSSAYGVRTWITKNGYDWTNYNPTWGATMWGDPVTAYDSLGNLFVDNMYGPSSIQGTKIAKTSDGGTTWTVVNGNTGNDKNWIAADQTTGPYANYIYGVMTPGNVKRSTDGGATFTQVFSSTNTYPGMMVAVGPNVIGGDVPGGCVYVVTNTGSAAYSVSYNFFVSTNGGANFTLKSSQSFAGYVGTWSSSRHSVQGVRTRPYPFITVDNSYGPYRGRLYCVYATNDPAGSGNKPDVYCRYSTNQGTTWSSPVRINDDANYTANHQWFPAPWCDIMTGKLYVQWMDTRDCPTSDSAVIYASYSTNGGVTFVQNQRISNAKMRIYCPTCGGGGTPVYQGDYNGIASNKKVSLLAWTDWRAGNFANYVAYFPDFAMRLSPAVDSLNPNNGTGLIRMVVPAVKLYTDTVIVTAVITPAPTTGTLSVTLPNGNKLYQYPDSLPMNITATGGVTAGNYTLTVTAEGPNGTPVHKRTATLVVSPLVGMENTAEIIGGYKLYQNYPNPFNPVTKIEYNLVKSSNVKITIYDMLGKVVASVKYDNQPAGKNYFLFNAANLSAGVYFYKNPDRRIF